MRGIDHDKIDSGRDQRLGPREAFIADRRGGGDAEPALLVLAGIRIGNRFFDVLHGDQADAAILRIDHQEFLDAMLMQKTLGLVLTHAFAHGDELLCHQIGNSLPRISGETNVAVGQNPHQLAGLSVPGRFNHRNSGNVVVLHQIERLLKSRPGLDRERVHHHAGFKFLHLADLRGLLVGLHVAVEHADAAGLRHGDRHLRLGHGIHRRSDDRNIDGDRAGDVRPDIDVRGQHFRQAGPDQHVVECEALARA